MENGYKCFIPTWDLYLHFKFDQVPITVINIQEFNDIPDGPALSFNSTIHHAIL